VSSKELIIGGKGETAYRMNAGMGITLSVRASVLRGTSFVSFSVARVVCHSSIKRDMFHGAPSVAPSSHKRFIRSSKCRLLSFIVLSFRSFHSFRGGDL